VPGKVSGRVVRLGESAAVHSEVTGEQIRAIGRGMSG